MTEITPPDGYEPTPRSFAVTVAADGSILVDGTPLNAFAAFDMPRRISPQPTVFTVVEGDDFVLGNGVPGAVITVTYPDGTVVRSTVNSDGIWLIPVPSHIVLAEGDILNVQQAVPGAEPSFYVQAVVLPRS